MTNLKCTVNSCAHHKNDCCCIPGICVGGEEARITAETCCNNFVERKDQVSNRGDQEENPVSDIKCQATNCTFNEDCKCHAKDICIFGHDACRCQQTECASFRMK